MNANAGVKSVEQLKEAYKVKDVIGMGAFASVRLAVNRQTRIKVAIKVVNKKRMSDDDLEDFENEVRLLSEIDHPNVV
jgi:serine/threonine protein kinase